MDLVPAIIDGVSVVLLVLTLFLGRRAVRAFRQSRQAVTESASLLEVIVEALTSRIQTSEENASELRRDLNGIHQRSNQLATEQVRLETGYKQLLEHVQEALTNDQTLVLELEQLKNRIVTLPQNTPRSQRPAVSHPSGQIAIGGEEALASLTPTEREVIEILNHEGPKPAPELGQRLGKSREHMARLMKKLYFEGYIDRETNKTPFRYRLNEKIRPALGSPEEPVTERVQG